MSQQSRRPRLSTLLVTAAALLVLPGCTPPHAELQPATSGQRAVMTALGRIDQSDEVFAVDLGQGRHLLGGTVTYAGSPTYKRPAMIVTDGDRVAIVTCAWDGSEALGVDTGQVGRDAVQGLVAELGQEICNPWTAPAPLK